MCARFLWGTPLSSENPVIAALTVEAAPNLRLPWLSRFNMHTLSAQLSAHPGLSLWVPRTGEYMVAEPWRHRADIASILEVTARKGKQALLRSLLDLLPAQGYVLVVLTDEVWSDQPGVYEGLGFEFIEKVVFLEKDLRSRASLEPSRPLPDLSYTLATQEELPLLVELDHASFPWLWWNSQEEFHAYLQLEGVYAYIGWDKQQPVGYASLTAYGSWAHLDRLAVPGQHHGYGYGAAQLQHALLAASALGASRIGLSTQENNTRSHRLYKGFDFHQTRDSMNLYGKYLAQPSSQSR